MTRIKYATFVALLATVAATNLALETWGVIPIGFGLEAPAGVFFAGLAFGLRDVLHETGGPRWVVGAILAGAALCTYRVPTGVADKAGKVVVATEFILVNRAREEM